MSTVVALRSENRHLEVDLQKLKRQYLGAASSTSKSIPVGIPLGAPAARHVRPFSWGISGLCGLFLCCMLAGSLAGPALPATLAAIAERTAEVCSLYWTTLSYDHGKGNATGEAPGRTGPAWAEGPSAALRSGDWIEIDTPGGGRSLGLGDDGALHISQVSADLRSAAFCCFANKGRCGRVSRGRQGRRFYGRNVPKPGVTAATRQPTRPTSRGAPPLPSYTTGASETTRL